MGEALHSVVVTKEKETPHTVRYVEVDETGKVLVFRTVYFQKNALPKPFPNKLRLTVSVE